MENKTITKIVNNSNTLFPLNKTHPYNDNIKYKFIPSKTLEKGVKSAVLEGKNVLTNELENALSSKIMNAHKDYF